MVQKRRNCAIVNNEEKNSSVVNQITKAAIALLEDHELADITVRQITERAGVSRDSFYRNFKDKEDILFRYVHKMLGEWNEAYKAKRSVSHAGIYECLFAGLKENGEFCRLLEKRGLFHLYLKALMVEFGPKPEHDNMSAYTAAFVTYGTYGWMREWLSRGMQEPVGNVTGLLNSPGM